MTDLSPWGYRNRCFLVALYCLIYIKETKLGSRDQEASPQQIKNWGSFSATSVHVGVSLHLFLVVWIFVRSLGVICYNRWVLIEDHKNYFKDWCLMNLQSTFLFLTYLNLWIMAILAKACKPNNFEGRCLDYFIVKLSLNQTLLIFLLYMRQTWMAQLFLAIFLWEVIFL